MDPVLSGSLCFLVLAIVMYIKFIREHPWGDDELDDGRGKSSPVESDSMPFLHPTSPVSVLQAQKQLKKQQQQQSQPVLRGPYKKVMQVASAATGGANMGGASAPYQHKKQPMRRRTHSATLGGTSGLHDGNSKAVAPSGAVGGAAGGDGNNRVMAMDQLPTTIFETHQEHFHGDSKLPPPVSSGRNQHRINFDQLEDEDDFDAEMGFLSPRRAHSDAANDSLDSVPFEDDDSDGFTDLENHLGTGFDDSKSGTLTIGEGDYHVRRRSHSAAQATDAAVLTPTVKHALATPSKAATIDRQFVRAVPPPAQMQLDMARKARIPLFLHSPMYVRTSAAPLVDDVAGAGNKIDANHEQDAKEQAANHQLALGAGNDHAAPPPGVGGPPPAPAQGAAAYAYARRRGKLPNKMKNQSLHIDFNELQVAEMIGQGAFGTVHRAVWRGTSVAVKILVCQYLTVDILEEFETEVQIMSILRHPNICLLMGACLEPPTRCLVIEYLPRGSLWNVLRQDVVIDLAKQLSFARDTALGMNYLHSFQPPILHRDLKSPNLLIDTSYALKISDFGLARVRAHFQTMTGNCGTTQWMAPEVLAAEKYTEKADVFSYGVVVWETITRECPYDGLSQIQAALGVLNNNLRPTVPEHCPPLFKKIMTLCWVSNPEERPTFETVLEILHNATDADLTPEPRDRRKSVTLGG